MTSQVYVLFWQDGHEERIRGCTFCDAFLGAGYKADDISRVSHWKVITGGEG